jgi:hypothetical protein
MRSREKKYLSKRSKPDRRVQKKNWRGQTRFFPIGRYLPSDHPFPAISVRPGYVSVVFVGVVFFSFAERGKIERALANPPAAASGPPARGGSIKFGDGAKSVHPLDE